MLQGRTYRLMADTFSRSFPDQAAEILPRRIVPLGTHYHPSSVLALFGGPYLMQRMVAGKAPVPADFHGSAVLESLATQLDSNLKAGVGIGTFGISPPEARVVEAYRQLHLHDTPVYFPSRELCLALLQTKLPEGLCLRDLKWPHPGMCWVLPTNLIKSATDGHAVIITASSTPKPETGKNAVIVGGICEVPHIFSVCRHLSDDSPLDEIFAAQEDLFPPQHSANETFVFTSDDRHFVEIISALVFNLLFVMTERPELLSGGNLSRPAKHKKGRTIEALWTPLTIGANYKVSKTGNAGDSQTDRAGVRVHWRRGHWRNHAHGQGRLLRKLLWIEPMLVGS